MAAPCAGIAQHAAHLIHQNRVFQKPLRRPAGTIGVAGQKDGIGNLARFCADMKAHLLPPCKVTPRRKQDFAV